MANFTQLTDDLAIIAALATLPNQTDGLSASQLKAKFDEASGLIKTFLNTILISELEAQGASAKLGAVVGGESSNIQAFIDLVESAGTGNLPPADSVTNTMMNSTIKPGLLSSLTTDEKESFAGAINEVDSNADGVASDLTAHEADETLHTNVMTTQGDIIYQGASNPERLAKGTAYQALLMNSGATNPQWLASLQSLMTAQGDIVYASGANSPARLAKGTAGQMLAMNSGATAPEWQTPVMIVEGSYAGDGTSNRTISTGITPKLVVIFPPVASQSFSIGGTGNSYGFWNVSSVSANTINNAQRPSVTTGGFVVTGTGTNSTNESGQTYRYFSIA